MPRPYWDSQRDEELRIYWEAGHTIDDIGKLMHTTRNAVVGRAWRLQLPKREPCLQRTYGPAPSSDLSGTRRCMFPVGDASLNEYRFCGQPVVLGRSYCPEHLIQNQSGDAVWAG